MLETAEILSSKPFSLMLLEQKLVLQGRMAFEGASCYPHVTLIGDKEPEKITYF